MVKCANGKRTFRKFRLLSAIFWLSVPVLSYLGPLLCGYGAQGAIEYFARVNSGPILGFIVMSYHEMGLEWIVWSAIASAIVFVVFLGYLCAKGIGVKAWVFLVLWYATGAVLNAILAVGMSS